MSQKNRYTGLTDAEVLESRRKHGVNVLTPPEQDPWWKEFLDKFSDPLIIILLVAGVLSIGISFYEIFGLGQDWKVFFEPIGIFVAIGLATTLAFIFEQKANKAFKILNQVNDDELVEVMRNGTMTTIPRKDVVVGDIVILNTGDEIPADGELLDAVTLSVDESTLTGEMSCAKFLLTVEYESIYNAVKENRITDLYQAKTKEWNCSDKFLIDDKEVVVDDILKVILNSTYPSNHVMRGTKVMEGHGVMRVLKVGDATEMGKVFEEAQIDDSVKTPLNEQLDGLADWITNVSYIFAGLIIVGQLIHFLGWCAWQAWTLVIPVALFFWLVIKKFEDWSKAKCILTIVGFFVIFFAMVIGAFSMLNPGADSDTWSLLLAHTLKTLMIAVTLIVVAVPEGLPMAVTLSLAYSMSRMLKTNNLVRKMHACETMGATTVICTDKTGTLTQNQMQVYKTNFFGEPSNEVLYEGIAVNSTAQLDLSGDKAQVLGNPTEGALLLWLNERGANYLDLRNGATRLEELPFTTERKYMATVVKSASGKNILYVKGASEIVFGMCKNTCGVTRAEIDAQLLDYQNQAMRTLGFAYQELGDKDATISDGKVVADKLTFLGIVAISDPVRVDVPAAVGEVIDAGIKVKIVTGDTPGTAKEIGRQIGLWNDTTDTDRNIITGPEFAELSDKELKERVGELKIIARARPMDKKRLVEALQANNEVVAVTGDGTNDAPALKTAHVGLSMGDGTSVAKEASDITIIDNSFSSIGRAVMWGRSLYKNIQRFLLFQLTVNVAACFLVLFGSFMGTESPLTVTQMLWVNLIMDTFGAMALASLPPSRSVLNDKPRKREASILSKPMLWELCSVGFVFFAITLGFYWLFNHAEVTSIPQMFHAAVGAENPMTPYEATLLFSIFVWTHFWYMFNARSFETGESVFKLKMSQGFWTIVGIIVIGQLFITEIAYEFFNVEPMLHTLDWSFNPSGAFDLLIIVAASSLVLWVREIYRLFKK
jgi:HAD ATPase, P-type, family IC